MKNDYQSALEWYKKTAEHGDCSSLKKIGYMYFEGEDVEQNYSEAFKYFKMAADLEYSFAIGEVAECYVKGYGVAADEEKALEYYRKFFAYHDDCELKVMRSMAENYLDIKNYPKAFEYYSKASEYNRFMKYWDPFKKLLLFRRCTDILREYIKTK